MRTLTARFQCTPSGEKLRGVWCQGEGWGFGWRLRSESFGWRAPGEQVRIGDFGFGVWRLWLDVQFGCRDRGEVRRMGRLGGAYRALTCECRARVAQQRG